MVKNGKVLVKPSFNRLVKIAWLKPKVIDGL